MTFWQRVLGSLRIWRAEQAVIAADVYMPRDWVDHNRARWFAKH